MTNLEIARRIIDDVRALGVVDFCVCSGSRNAPLIAVIGEGVEGVEGVGDHGLDSLDPLSPRPPYSFVDERSAAFFAVGRARRDERPVAVITTSGTAAAELLPAAVEAYYSGTPIVLITADRPARYRGTGAPQAIEQESLFGIYAARSIETWNRRMPLHLNVEFDEPLL